MNLKEVRMEGSPDIRLGIRVTLGHDSDAKKLDEDETWSIVGSVFGII